MKTFLREATLYKEEEEEKRGDHMRVLNQLCESVETLSRGLTITNDTSL